MSHIFREIVKLRFQKRTYFGWALLFIVPFLVTIGMRYADRPHGGGSGGDGQFFFNAATDNGLYVALGSLFFLSAFLLPLLAAISGSQTLAGEAENGTLRTVLMQPVRRGSVLAAKLLVATLYIGAGLLVLLIGSLIAGGAVFGLHPLTLIVGGTVGVGHAIGLTVAAYLLVLMGMAAVVSLALVFSSLTNSGLSAMGVAMGLVIVMIILGNLPYFDFLHPYLFTSHFSAWVGIFRDPVAWGPIRDAMINFAVWITGMGGIAWLIFRRKDILS